MSGAGAQRIARLRLWHAEATPEAVHEMRSILAAGDVLVPVRSPDDDLPRIDEALPPGAVVIRTSGSTGQPRHIVIPAAAFEESARVSAARLDLRPDDVWWASLSPAHVGGIALLRRADMLGCEIEPTGGFDASVFWDLCASRRITHASLVPTMLRRILEARPGDADASSLRAVLIGGAAADPEMLRRAIDVGIPVATTWGMTETASQVATATPGETASDPTHAGRPLPGVSVRAGVGGRLAVRTPTMALGELVEGRLRALTGEEGWYLTDDLGRIDEAGFVRITGRASDRIISGGVNVDPVDIERGIRALPWVDDVAVVGMPDPEWGERVVAVVVARSGGEAPGPALPTGAHLQGSELEVLLPESLTGARRPKAVRIVSELPVNRNGKVDRAAVRTLLEPAE